MDVGVCIGNRRECLGGYGIDKLPRISAACAVSISVVVSDGAMTISRNIGYGVVLAGDGGNFTSASIGKRCRCGHISLAGTGDVSRAVLRYVQSRQFNDVGVSPVVAVSCAVGKVVCVSDSSLAASDVSVDGGKGVAYLGAAVVGHGRDMRCRDNGIDQTADGVETVLGGDHKVLWHDVIGVAPSVVGAVDLVSIDEGGVAAAVGEGGGVGAGSECDRGAAVGDGRQGGGEDLREAVNRSGVIGRWGKSFGIEGISIGPDGVVSSAVGVSVTEHHRTGIVRIDAGGAVHKFGDDTVAAHIGDGVCIRSHHIHLAGHGIAPVGWHIGDDFWQGNVVGESPIPTVSRTVGESIGIYDVALATIETAVVHSWFGSRKRVAASVGDCGFDNIVFNCVC